MHSLSKHSCHTHHSRATHVYDQLNDVRSVIFCRLPSQQVGCLVVLSTATDIILAAANLFGPHTQDTHTALLYESELWQLSALPAYSWPGHPPYQAHFVWRLTHRPQSMCGSDIRKMLPKPVCPLEELVVGIEAYRRFVRHFNLLRPLAMGDSVQPLCVVRTYAYYFTTLLLAADDHWDIDYADLHSALESRIRYRSVLSTLNRLNRLAEAGSKSDVLEAMWTIDSLCDILETTVHEHG